MIQLFFEVEHQRIKRTDTFKPVAKSVNYLHAHFDFLTEEWDNQEITAIFKAGDIVKEEILDAENNCLVPYEVLQEEGDIYVSCFAGNLITATKSRVHIYETGYADIETDEQSEVEEDGNSTS